MAWTTIETPNAKYVLLFSRHKRQSEKAPEKFDALVLEQTTLLLEELINTRQYTNVVKQATEQGKQIWITDAIQSKRAGLRYVAGEITFRATPLLGLILLLSAQKEKIKRRAFIKKAVAWGVLSPVIAWGATAVPLLHQKEIRYHKVAKVNAKISELIGGYGTSTARNLLTAEKCESWLAPKLQQELGRKPTIAMVWGSGHYGIMGLLLHPEERQRLLQKYGLNKFVKADYPKSFRIELKPDGTIKEIKEFPDTFPKQKKSAELPEPKTKQPELFGRRQLFSKTLDRMRRL